REAPQTLADDSAQQKSQTAHTMRPPPARHQTTPGTRRHACSTRTQRAGVSSANTNSAVYQNMGIVTAHTTMHHGHSIWMLNRDGKANEGTMPVASARHRGTPTRTERGSSTPKPPTTRTATGSRTPISPTTGRGK